MAFGGGGSAYRLEAAVRRRGGGNYRCLLSVRPGEEQAPWATAP